MYFWKIVFYRLFQVFSMFATSSLQKLSQRLNSHSFLTVITFYFVPNY